MRFDLRQVAQGDAVVEDLEEAGVARGGEGVGARQDAGVGRAVEERVDDVRHVVEEGIGQAGLPRRGRLLPDEFPETLAKRIVPGLHAGHQADQPPRGRVRGRGRRMAPGIDRQGLIAQPPVDVLKGGHARGQRVGVHRVEGPGCARRRHVVRLLILGAGGQEHGADAQQRQEHKAKARRGGGGHRERPFPESMAHFGRCGFPGVGWGWLRDLGSSVAVALRATRHTRRRFA